MDQSAIFRLIPLLIAVSVNILLALLVFLNNPRSVTNRIYAILSVVISVWLTTNYLVLDLNIIGGSLLWSRLTIFWATPMSFLFYLFAYTVPDSKLILSRRVFWTLLFITGVVMLVTISPYAFVAVKIVKNSLQPIPGVGMLPFTVISTFYTAAAVFLLIRKYYLSKGIQKQQFLYIMLGIVIMLSLIILTVLLPVVFFHSVSFVQFIPLYTLTFLGMTTYAIIRHKMLDLRLIVARSVTYLFILLILGASYSFYILFVGSRVFNLSYSVREYLFYGFAMFVVAFTFQPLRRLLEGLTDTIFYRGYYDSQKLLEGLSAIMSSTIGLEQLTNRILEAVLTQMRITRGAFVLTKGKDSGEIEYVESMGYDNSLPRFSRDAVLLFLSRGKIVLFDDLDEGVLKDLMRNLGISVILPLVVHGESIGVVVFSDKASGNVYSQQDINVLEVLSRNLSVAIQNSKEYEEIKRFNLTLRDEVDKATKDLQDANQRLKDLDRLKDEFVSVASHELRTPMTAVKSYLWMALSGKGGQLTDKQDYYVRRAYNSGDRLIKLVNDMLNVSRIESGRISMEVRSVEVLELSQDVVEEIIPRADELGVKVVLDRSFIPSSPVLADPDKIKEVLFNLVGNSLKFTPAGGSITVSFTQKENMIETRVKDTGVGIDQDNLSHLFQKFGILPGSYTANQAAMGTGLGLYICKSIVELQGGKIWAESEGKGHGTTFAFTLPVFTEEGLRKFGEEHKVDDQKQQVGLEHTEV